MNNFTIRAATVSDVPVILELIKALATYERAPDEVLGHVLMEQITH